VGINDPYSCPETTASQLSLYRRPLPATSLRFLPAIMWDGREPDLVTQAKNATLVHTEPLQPPTDQQLQQIVIFESLLFTAQSADNLAGTLGAHGGRGGPIFLALQPFYPGINPNGTNAFDLYSRYNLKNTTSAANAARAAIARGEDLFNNRPMNISGVAGFNDVRGQAIVVGTCGTCHNAPNVGSGSTPTMMDIGTSSPKAVLPSYTVLCNDGTQLVTSDPGRALITGKCADLNKVKVPSLRGLAARAPYFHNGSSSTLLEVLNFYDQRFNMLLTDEEKADLVVFLNSL
jgi:cytochrome c peroxidase